MKIQLIDGWYTFHKWWSARLKLIAAAVLLGGEAAQHLLFSWGVLPDEFKESIPENWIVAATVFILIASFLAQFVRQRKPHEEAERHGRKRS